MRICALYSGSRGNAVFVECGGVKLLIDAGKSAHALKKALADIGVSFADLDAILVTHEHCDHISALEGLREEETVPIHAAGRCAEKLASIPSDYIQNNLVTHTPLFRLELDGVSISSFVTPHDSACSVGYRIEWQENGITHRIGYATDVGYVSDEVEAGLSGCEAVVIEANHDVDMLRSGPYPYHLKQRILSRRGHLSNADCALLASRLAQGGTKYFLLAHLSEKNNNPSLALDEVFSALGDSKIRLVAADPKLPTRLVWEERADPIPS